MRKVLAAPTALLLLFTVGCGNVGVEKPQSFSERLIAAEASAKVVIDQLTKLVVSGVIKPGTKEEHYVTNTVKSIDSALNAAQEQWKGGKETLAEQYLAVATSSIAGAKEWLQQRSE